ncbi:4'-phosphopantetheinyl transferase superfamily protein [Zobellia roscoffensis]|uniref:4'-phosphopantetheinyl transferase family protein n=1 Tax=Zobellia roscoffensis TaxID=2779508 RepID=UPI00188C5CCA|nr:4'-phosphopantetheinyl transferase superfamily protein [Zobellia roscoffensis]
MKLLKSEAHIWNFNVNDFDALYSYQKLLSPDELERAGKFKFEKDRKTYILARGLLRDLSGRYLGVPPENISFKYSDYGKPHYNQETSLRFNVSHSGELIVLAFVTQGQVGVDVERIKPNFDSAKIAREFFSPDEVSEVLSYPEASLGKAFFNCWTRKESFIKAKGAGLSFDLTSFSVSIHDDFPQLLRTQWNPKEKDSWKFFSFVPQEGYFSALCVSSEIENVSCFDIVHLNRLRCN